MSEACGINDGDTVIGSSLGGMVACEIAKIRSLRALYLIGSAVRKEEINSFLRALRPLVQIAPLEWLKLSAGSIPLDLAQMFAVSDGSFIRGMCSALFEWEGLGDPPIRVVRIHGKYDLVIPPPKTVDLLLEGGHLISITQAEACVAYLSADLPQA